MESPRTSEVADQQVLCLVLICRLSMSEDKHLLSLYLNCSQFVFEYLYDGVIVSSFALIIAMNV